MFAHSSPGIGVVTFEKPWNKHARAMYMPKMFGRGAAPESVPGSLGRSISPLDCLCLAHRQEAIIKAAAASGLVTEETVASASAGYAAHLAAEDHRGSARGKST